MPIYPKLIFISFKNVSFSQTIFNDAPEPWGLFFQDNATPQMEGLEELERNYVLPCNYTFVISWIMLSLIINYTKPFVSK